MHCFRDAPSLHRFLNFCPSPELHRLIHAQLEALAAFDDVPLGDLAHFFIVEPGDSAGTLESALDRNLTNISIDHCLSHIGWFELVSIVSDDGFGNVIFIPKDIADQSLLNFCASHFARTLEDGS